MMLALLLAQTLVLGRVGTGTPAHELEVRAGPCRDGFRELAVQVLVEGKSRTDVTATMPEHWSHALCALVASGDGWIASEEEPNGQKTEMSVSVRATQLGNGVQGALVSIEAGREHFHRSHALFVEVDGVAQRVWSDGDSVGPATSRATPSADAIAFVYELGFGPDDDSVDDWRGERIGWDPAAKRITKSSFSAFATVAGTYTSVASARADQLALRSKCRAVWLLVLKTDQFPKLAPGKFVIANIATSNVGAQESLGKLTRCGVPGYVKRAQ